MQHLRLLARPRFYSSMGVPDRWLEYTRFNHPVDRILPMKTPLKSTFNTGLSRPDMDKTGINEKLAMDEEFTPLQCVADTKRMGLSVGVVIDLTYTKRYYSPQEFLQQGIKHHKIFCEGHVIPSEEVYKEFASVLNDFLQEKSCKDQIAAVHCTHGINRTGYLVCRYLIEELGWNPERAITEFGSARGHVIERENYLDHLRKGCPPLPVPPQRKASSSGRHRSPYRHERNTWQERREIRSNHRDRTRPDQRRWDDRQAHSDSRAHNSRQQRRSKGSHTNRELRTLQPHTDMGSRAPHPHAGMGSWAPQPHAGMGSWAPQPHTGMGSWAPRSHTGTGSWAPQPHTGMGSRAPHPHTGMESFAHHTRMRSRAPQPHTSMEWVPHPHTGIESCAPRTRMGSRASRPQTRGSGDHRSQYTDDTAHQRQY